MHDGSPFDDILDFWVRNSKEESFSDAVRQELKNLILRLKKEDSERNQSCQFIFSMVKARKYIDRIYALNRKRRSEERVINAGHIERQILAFRNLSRLLQSVGGFVVRHCYFDEAGKDAHALRWDWRRWTPCEDISDDENKEVLVKENKADRSNMARHNRNLVAIIFSMQKIFIEPLTLCTYLYPRKSTVFSCRGPYKVYPDYIPPAKEGYAIIRGMSTTEEYWVEEKILNLSERNIWDTVRCVEVGAFAGNLFLDQCKPFARFLYIPRIDSDAEVTDDEDDSSDESGNESGIGSGTGSGLESGVEDQ